MHPQVAAIAWAALYAMLVIGPLLLMPIGIVPEGRGFWVEFSLAMGFLGLAQLAIQFVLIARFKRVTAPYGIDAIMYYHRQVGALAVLVIVAHPLVLIVREPATLALLNPFGGSWANRTGAWSLFTLLLLAVLSFLRRPLMLPYEWWRTSHAVLALAGAGLAVAHVTLAGPYVTTGWKPWFWIAFVSLGVAALMYLRLIRPLQERRHPYRVVEIRPEAARIWSLVLEPIGHAGLRFEPGQFAWLKLANAFTVDEHPFSFSSSAERPERLEFGIKEVGDFTGNLPTVRPGAPVYLDGPHGAFSIDRVPAAGYVFISGGIGIVPILSMLRTMLDRRDCRPALLIYAAENAESLAYRDELDALRRQMLGQLDVVYVLERPPAAWAGECGWVSREVLERHWPSDRIRREVLLCGPDPMIVKVDAALREMGVASDRMHAERFDLV